MALLEVDGLHVDIPVAAGSLHAVRDVGFRVETGETLCLVGESGCGKTLTALSVMGLLPKKARLTAERLVFSGTDLTALREPELERLRGSRMSMIFQEPMTSLNPVYTIGDQLGETLVHHRGASRPEARDRAIHLLERVGIQGAERRLGQYPHELSGGLRQRVMIAMALMCEPQLIIADEPTTALDVTIQAQILHLLAELQREMHMALLLITHDLGIVARIADRVAVMYAGEVVEEGSAANIFDTPLHPYTQGLLACIPVPGRTVRGEFLGSIPGMVPSLIGEVRGCSFRNRCPHRTGRCAHVEQGLTRVDGDHGFRCVLGHEQLAGHARSVRTS